MISKRFLLVLALALAGIAAKAQAVIMNGDYFLTHNEAGTSVNTAATTTFNPETCLWAYARRDYIRTANSNGIAINNNNNYLQYTSLSLGTDWGNWYRGDNNESICNRTGNQGNRRYHYPTRNGTTWGWATDQTSNGSTTYLRNCVIDPHDAIDNLTNPSISISSISGNTINFSHTNLSGTYTPAYTTYTFNSTTHYWYDDGDHTSVPSAINVNSLNPIYTWSVTTGDSYASINSSTGVLTITGNPTGNITVRLTVSNISPMNDKTVDFTLTRAYVGQSTNTETTINSFSLSPNSAALYEGQSQAFTASAIVNITTYNTPAHISLTGGGNTYLYYNGTLYTNTEDFSTTTTASETPNFTWSMTGAGSGSASLSATSGASTTLTHTPGVSSDMTLTLTVEASYSRDVSETKSAQVSLYAPFVAPTITRSGNNVILSTNSLGATIYYTTDGSTPSASNGTVYTAPINLEDLTLPVTIKAIAVRGGESTPIAEETFSTLSLEKPVISISSTGVVTITSSTEGASIRYTTDGTAPSSTSGTLYNGTFNVSNLTTVKAIAYKDGYADSEIASETYVASGVSGGMVILNDLEPHSWSYYSDATNPVCSLNPADVKITYFGNGKMYTSTTANPSGNLSDATGVQVSTTETEHTFVYYKTLERANFNGTGNLPYNLIPNPFSKRPTFTSGGTSYYTGFYGWRVKRLSGVTISGYGVGDIIPAETDIEFVTANEYNNEVDFEAVWARAFVFTTIANLNSATNGNYVADANGEHRAYERNFVVVNANVGTTANTRPATISCLNPDGTGEVVTRTGVFTLNADTKFEYINLSNADGTFIANNHYLCFGRGISTSNRAASWVRGQNPNATLNDNLDYTIRMESGAFTHFVFLYHSPNTNRTFGGLIQVKAILGCDYDRATGNNALLDVCPEASSGNNHEGLFYAQRAVLGNSGNNNLKTFDCVVKSGQYLKYYWTNNNDGAYDHSFYCGPNSAGNTYPGVRYVTVEGGEFSSMNGGRGVGSENEQYFNPQDLTFVLRIKGGLFHGSVFGGAADNPSIGSRRIVITGGTIHGWVAAGANGTGSVTGSSAQTKGNSYIYVGGNSTIGGANVTVNGTPGGNVFGAGRGNTNQMCSIYVSNVVVADNTTINQSVYGGGYNGYTEQVSNVYVMGGTVNESVYGGGYNHGGSFNNNPKNTLASNVYMTGGTVMNGVYGGSNSTGTVGDVTMHIDGGTVGNGENIDGVWGGGYGSQTIISGDVELTVGVTDATEGATVNGDVYGGSALGRVNGTAATNTYHTYVTLNTGVINGSLYGGGLGDNNTEANVYGPVQVKVYGGSVRKTDANGANGSGGVYGANNINGAPQRSVEVDIYGTDPAPSDDEYALYAVYGGGNQADYTYGNGYPIVRVHNCDNSIEYVYGGGNAADVASTDVTIWGGNTIGTVFGGGNGTVTPAHVTPGGTDVKIYGGTIGQVFGGSNSQGTIAGTINVNVNKQTEEGHEGCEMHIGEVYGGGNLAASNAGNITVGCTGGEGEGIGDLYGGANQANITGNITLNITGGSINNVFGGNNTSGTISGDIQVNVNWGDDCTYNYLGNVYGGGNLAPYAQSTANHPEVNIFNGTVTHNVYGGGKGTSAVVTGSPIVTIGDNVAGHSASVLENVFGGGDAAAVTGNTLVNYVDNNTSSQVGKLFGGGNAASVSGTSTVNMTTQGLVTNGIYGGCNASGNVGEVTVNVVSGTVGASGSPAEGIFGGGYGSSTTTSSNITVTIGTEDGAGQPVIYGDIYGGSALGSVNGSINDLTNVNFYNGTLVGNLYGGGLGDDDHAAAVNGYVIVNIGSSTQFDNPENCHSDLTAASVYGCNNNNGTPQGDVTVNVYCTGHTDDNTVNGTGYAIDQVFGGGNQADYNPQEGKASTVNIFGCFNTIRRSFGGGNAAATPGVTTVIDGGRFDQVFGGGNGEVTAANINGDVSLTLHGGIVGQLYGGSNTSGEISGDLSVVVDNTTGCESNLLVDEFFCGGNFADIDGDLVTDILCSDGMEINNLYGGCNQADINGSVVLNVYGGIYTNVFGGSKGRLAGTNGTNDPGKSANISGTVTLNLYGGTIENVFGGSNVKGNISGLITVNVIDVEGECPLYITNVYGGSNLTSYTPTDPSITSPVVNVVHAKYGISGNVFGGSKGVVGTPATVTANPRVNIGYDTDMDDYIPDSYTLPTSTPRTIVAGSIFGGCDAAQVIGNTEVYFRKRSKVFGNIYGGGNMGEVTGNTKVIVDRDNN